MTVQASVVTVELGPLVRRISGFEKVVHSSSTISVILTRLAPPWSNTHVVLDDGHHRVVASTSGLQRRALLRSLAKTGLRVDIARRWLGVGLDRVR